MTPNAKTETPLRLTATLALALALPLLAACENGAGGTDPQAAATPDEVPSEVPSEAPAGVAPRLPEPGGAGQAAARPQPTRETVPEIYMALQQDSAGSVSVIFAVDESKDGTPSDEPAIRLSPEDERCRVQELRRYSFEGVERPIFSVAQVEDGITARQMPAFLALAVTEAMLASGLAETRDDTAPQNACTNLFWQQELQRAQAGGATG